MVHIVMAHTEHHRCHHEETEQREKQNQTNAYNFADDEQGYKDYAHPK
jgi:hypothetical protein